EVLGHADPEVERDLDQAGGMEVRVDEGCANPSVETRFEEGAQGAVGRIVRFALVLGQRTYRCRRQFKSSRSLRIPFSDRRSSRGSVEQRASDSTVAQSGQMLQRADSSSDLIRAHPVVPGERGR